MADIDVFVDLEDAAAFAGIGSEFLEGVSARSCTIDPPEVRDSLNDNQRSIIEFLCIRFRHALRRPVVRAARCAATDGRSEPGTRERW